MFSRKKGRGVELNDRVGKKNCVVFDVFYCKGFFFIGNPRVVLVSHILGLLQRVSILSFF